MADECKIEFTKLFINNEFVNSKSGKTFPVRNPATEKVICEIQEGDKDDIDRAVKAAKDAFGLKSEWRTMDASKRGLILMKLCEIIEKNSKKLAVLNTLETGKPLGVSEYEVSILITGIRYYAGLADKFNGRTIPADGTVFSYTKKEPIGVCGLIIPWNFPLSVLAFKMGAALGAGCTVIIKPAELTSIGTVFLASLIKEAGFPPGVVNIVPGYGPKAGAALASHMNVDKISFTGSTVTGKAILKYAADSNLKKVTLELGGKSPLIVFPDADLDKAVEIAHQSIMFHSGQVCCAGSRTYVHADIYEAFLKKSVERTNRRKVGDGFDKTSESGPQIDERGLNKILDLIESGKKEGATLLCGGKRMNRPGYFVEPTIFSNVNENMRIGKEEIFGPVQSVFKFHTIDEVIEKANQTHYGLAAIVLSENINTCLQVANSIDAGTIWVNCAGHFAPQQPFGGYKASGIGREIGVDGFEEFLQIKTVCIMQNGKL